MSAELRPCGSDSSNFHQSPGALAPHIVTAALWNLLTASGIPEIPLSTGFWIDLPGSEF